MKRIACKTMILLAFAVMFGCASIKEAFMGPDMGHPAPENYVGNSSLTAGLHQQLCGSYFNESEQSKMVVEIHAGNVYSFEFLPKLVGNNITYVFEVYVPSGNLRDGYMLACADIMNTIQTTIPEENWGKLDPTKFYDRSHL
jgi:hypothetical protein